MISSITESSKNSSRNLAKHILPKQVCNSSTSTARMSVIPNDMVVLNAYCMFSFLLCLKIGVWGVKGPSNIRVTVY